MESGIYKIELNYDYFYIGQSQCLRKRKCVHFARLKKGNHENIKLQRVFNKYGGNKFTILEYCSLDIISKREQFYIDAHFNERKCCNLSPSANTVRGCKRSLETKRLNSLNRLGVKLSNEHKESISKGLLNAYETTRLKPNLKGENNPFYNKKHSIETKKHLSKLRKNKLVGGLNYNSKLLLNMQTGIYYGSCIEASLSCGLSSSNLRRMVNGGRKNNTNFKRV